VEHLQSLDEVTGAWAKLGGYVAEIGQVTESITGTIVHFAIPPVPPEIPILIGECLHNTRSFLDNLAFALALSYSGDDFTPEMQETSEFPIFFEREMTDREQRRKIGGMDPDAQRID